MTHQVLSSQTFESEDKARAREQDPRRQEALHPHRAQKGSNDATNGYHPRRCRYRPLAEGKAERAAAIGPAGTNVTDHVALDGSSHVAVTADIDDLGAVQALLASPPAEVAAQMESHGVRPPITVYIEK